MKRRAFTMVELICSMSVVMVFSGVTFLLYRDAQNREWEVTVRADAAEQFGIAARYLRSDIAGAANARFSDEILDLGTASYRIDQRGLVRTEGEREQTLSPNVVAWEVTEYDAKGFAISLRTEFTDGARWRTVSQSLDVARRVHP